MIREVITPPAQVQRVELGRTFRVKRRKDRRVFVAHFEDWGRDFITIRGVRGVYRRTIAATRLLQDFDQVERCGRCGWHHKLREIPERCRA